MDSNITNRYIGVASKSNKENWREDRIATYTRIQIAILNAIYWPECSWVKCSTRHWALTIRRIMGIFTIWICFLKQFAQQLPSLVQITANKRVCLIWNNCCIMIKSKYFKRYTNLSNWKMRRRRKFWRMSFRSTRRRRVRWRRGRHLHR